MHRGYLKIWRKIQDHKVFQNDALFKLFIHLLLNANITEKTWDGTSIHRGDLVVGRDELARDLREKPSTVYKRLRTLAGPDYNLIRLKSNNRYTIVSILNYGDYQDSKVTVEQRGNNEVATVEQRGNNEVALLKNSKECKKEETRARATHPNLENEAAEALAKKVLAAYPLRAKKDGRAINRTVHDQDVLISKIRKHPDFEWERAARLMNQIDTPPNMTTWLLSQPDKVQFAQNERLEAEGQPNHLARNPPIVDDYKLDSEWETADG